MLAKILAFFGPVATSIKGSVNFAELLRAVLSSVGASTVVGLAMMVLTAINADAANIFSPGLLSSATFGLGLLLDLLRRLDHGADPAPAQPAAPVAAKLIEDYRAFEAGNAIYRGTFFDPPNVAASVPCVAPNPPNPQPANCDLFIQGVGPNSRPASPPAGVTKTTDPGVITVQGSKVIASTTIVSPDLTPPLGPRYKLEDRDDAEGDVDVS